MRLLERLATYVVSISIALTVGGVVRNFLTGTFSSLSDALELVVRNLS